MTVTVPRAPVALYVHVPFCVSICPYCDFVVYAGTAARGPAARVAAYLGALRTEIELRADIADARFGLPGGAAGSAGPPALTGSSGAVAGSSGPPALAGPPGAVGSSGAPGRAPLETVYLGGGTPTLLPSEALAGVLDLVRRRFGIAHGAEVTIEANPGSDERGDARALAEAGFNRLSLGAQAMDLVSLRRVGRRHRPGDVGAAVDEARAAGFRSISLDLLYDTPGQSTHAWSDTLDAALALAPDHVSAYALTLDDPDEEGLTGRLGDHLPTRPGARRWREAAIHEQSEDRAAGQYELAVDRLGAGGYRGYEISNWGLPGHESRHNLVYWQRRAYEAVGPGAHAFDGVARRWNGARFDGYLAALAPARGSAPSLPPGGVEPVSGADAAAETVILALRLDTGLALEAAEKEPLGPHLAWALETGLLEGIRRRWRAGAPDDARPPPLERALLTARLGTLAVGRARAPGVHVSCVRAARPAVERGLHRISGRPWLNRRTADVHGPAQAGRAADGTGAVDTCAWSSPGRAQETITCGWDANGDDDSDDGPEAGADCGRDACRGGDAGGSGRKGRWPSLPASTSLTPPRGER